jgi:hypothetical protein
MKFIIMFFEALPTLLLFTADRGIGLMAFPGVPKWQRRLENLM